MTPLLLAELATYTFMEIIPCSILTAAPFYGRLTSRRALAVFTALLYLLAIVRRFLAMAAPTMTSVLYLAWIVFYVCACHFVLRAPTCQLLFVLFIVLDYALLISILFTYIGFLLFPAAIAVNPHCFLTSLTALILYIPTFPLIYLFFTRRIAPLTTDEGQGKIWRYLWLAPATFTAVYFYSFYTVSGARGFSSPGGNVLFTLLVSAGSFFVLYPVLRLVEENGRTLRLESENHLLSIQALQYKNLMVRIEETSRARHDLRQYATVLQSYLRSGDRETLNRFVTEVCTALPPDTPLLYCKNTTLNAVISYYAGQADRSGISFNAQAGCPETLGVKDADLVVLLGNLLENAVESCEREREGEPFLRLAIQCSGENIVIILDNSCGDSTDCHDGCFHSTKHKGDGIGIASVRQIAALYGGVAKFEQNEGVFHASVMLQQMQPAILPKFHKGTSNIASGGGS